MQRILAINPKGKSTEAALFENESCLVSAEICHSSLGEDVEKQTQQRKQDLLEKFFSMGLNISKCTAIVGRGGILRPLEGGTYCVNEHMKEDLRDGFAAGHASAIGGWLAESIANDYGIPAYIVDPVTVDELADVARMTGIPEIKRKSVFHALSHKAAARKAANMRNIPYEEGNFIVLHLGGGISIGAHKAGCVIDVNNSLDGEGPLAPERAGTLPAGDMIALCYSGDFTETDLKRKISTLGGLTAHLGTGNLDEVERRIEEGDDLADKLLDAMVYQSAKEIGAMAAALRGEVQAIVLTGRLNDQSLFVQRLLGPIAWIADVFVFPGENILESLASGAFRVLTGLEEAKNY
ncbi:butyrate kinase [Aciduricibacillus chroicocephali]|uniref:Probable butyrate kinase n=1 Tax=Aciduricibacillus chroicocephali TaxID=3054939 RepID=A0ABY9KRS0_9BACI|nr:butyrate kinase [Bacillaceae bacterium 44XB]